MPHPLVLAVIAALSHVLGAMVFVRLKHISTNLRYALLAFSAGFLFSITFLDLLPPVLTRDPRGPMIVLVGFFLVFVLQHWLDPHVVHTHHLEEQPEWITDAGHLQNLTQSGRWVIPVLLGLTIHSFFDGVLLGSAYATLPHLGWMAFSAIFVHKFPVGLTLTAVILATGARFRTALTAATMLGVMTILGTLATWQLTDLALPALGLSAGSLLYVTTVEFVPIVYHAPRRWFSLILFVGLVVGAWI